VLDPFVGTGTAMLRALELGRRAIGIDTSEEYLAVAERRLASFVQQPSLF
jgi:DNA modification methylase